MKKVINLSLVLAMLLGFLPPAKATAQTCSESIVVVNTNDSDAGSLRQAIADVCEGGTITFDTSLSGATIELTSQLTLDKSVTINASVLANRVTVDGKHSVRVLQVSSGVTATLDSLRLINGYTGDFGGGIHNAGDLTVNNAVISYNSSTSSGAGIYNAGGTLLVTDSSLDFNYSGSQGGAIFNASDGSVTVVNSTFKGNEGSSGGAIATGSTTITSITSSTLTENKANNSTSGSGGGLYNLGMMTVVNSTLNNNAAPQWGGGIYNNVGTLTLLNSTLSGNAGHVNGYEGHGLANVETGTLNYANTIIANSPYGNACYNDATIDTNSNNMVEEDWSDGCAATFNDDPLLGPLQDNSGPTHTMALLAGSPAIDDGDATYCPEFDQRGISRPQGSACDLGAYELEETLSDLIVNAADDVVDTACTAAHCSLREAVSAATSGDTITFAESLSGATITLTSQLTLDKSVNIDASALASRVTVDANNSGRVLLVYAGVTATLDSLRLINGNASDFGGGIHNAGTLTVNNTVLANNQSYQAGAGIFNTGGTLLVTNSSLENNHAIINSGGAIYNAEGGSVEVVNSTLSGNQGLSGGGIFNASGTTITITGSTLTGNQATNTSSGTGGGLNNAGTMTVVNSTLTGNTSRISGGGIYNFWGTLTLYNSTLSGNIANPENPVDAYGYDLANEYGSTLHYANTIIANSSDVSACYNNGTISTNLNNLVMGYEHGCGASLTADPLLGTLADNGGPTHTMALLTGSPAFDAGDDTVCAAVPVNGVDQRGVARPQGEHCDIGAYEIEVTPWVDLMVNATDDVNDGVCDATHCSLREAVSAAVSGDTITFAENLSGGTITLATELYLDKSLTIDGSELDSKVSISGNNLTRVFFIVYEYSVYVNLESLIITGGNPGVNGNGGGIYNGGSLAINNCSLINNFAVVGGGILNSGTVSITNSTLSQNNATNGGALTNLGVATLTGCTLSDNEAEAGAGIDVSDGTLTVTDSTISGNAASSRGGGIYVSQQSQADVFGSTFVNNIAGGSLGGGGIINYGTTSVVNSTFTGNEILDSSGRGSAINNGVFGTLTLYNSTLSGNTGWVTLNNESGFSGGGMSLANTIIANSTGWDCSTYDGTLTLSTNNWVSDGEYSGDTCGATNFGDPMLDSLADNGGLTHTMALQVGSLAIDAGDDTICAAAPVNGVDQRGVIRPQGSHCDIGAFELEQTATTGALMISKTFEPLTSGFTGDFTIAYDCDDGETHDGTVTLEAGGSETITGIPIGTTCTITEPTLPTAPIGWTFGTPTFSPADGIVTISETLAEVVVTNTISQDPDTLPDTLPVGTVGFPYSQQLTAVGGTGPYTWWSSGLPSYLGIEYNTGEFYSFGNLLPTAGTINFQAIWYDSLSSSFTKNYSLTVSEALTISPEALPSGKVNEAYSQVITLSGGTAPYTITPLTLPAGLSSVIDAAAGTISLSGTPTAYGTFSVAVQAEDALGVKGAQTYGLWIEPERAFTWDPSAPEEREPVTFTPLSGLGSSYYWRSGYEPGAPCSEYGSYGSTFVRTFYESGQFQVCLDYWNGTQMVYDSQWVTVTNIAPVIYGIDIYPIPALVGMTVGGYVEYDRGPTPFTCRVNWGDDTGTETFDCGTTYDRLPPHTYTTTGTFTIQVWVTDGDELTGTATRDLDVAYLYALPSDMLLASDTVPTTIELQAAAAVGHTDLTFNIVPPTDFVGSLGTPVLEECVFYEEGAYLCRATVLYTPPSTGYTSPFSTAFDFNVSDDQSNTSNSVTVGLYVAENSAPTALDGSAMVSTVNPSTIRLWATDPDFYEVEYETVSDPMMFIIDSGPTEGTLTYSGWTGCDLDWDEINGDHLSCFAIYTYTPNPDTIATSDSFTFYVNDSHYDSGTATFSLDLHAPATLTVNTTDDVIYDGCSGSHCSLREAVADALVGDIIEFDLTYPATITLVEEPIAILKDLVINGPGADLLSISGGGGEPENPVGTRVFTIGDWENSTPTVFISGLTIRDGRADEGGGVYVYRDGTLTMEDCVIGPNNIVTYAGGGIFNNGGQLTLNRCTVTKNEGTGSLGGAGVTTAYGGASTTIINSTISGNITNNYGGGLFVGDECTVTLIHTTVSGNISNANYLDDGEERGGGAGIYIDPYADDFLVYLQNSIVAGNTDMTDPDTAEHEKWPDVYGNFTSLGGNIIGDTIGSTNTWDESDQVGTTESPLDPKLGALLKNDPGKTLTMALLTDSPALDAVDCAEGITEDQRGVTRPQGTACDIGAYELEQTAATGELKISKVFDPLTSGFTGTFTIFYDCGGEDWAYISLGAGGSQTITDIPIGSTCSVTESTLPTPPTGWTFGSPTYNPITGMVTISETLAEVTVTNSISRDLGELTISKVFDPGDSGFIGDFTIAYDCNDGETHDGTVTLAAGGSETISGIPTGTSCTVTEPNLPTAPTGWTFGTATFNPIDGTVTISETLAEVTVTNTISRDLGALTISKVFDPGDSGFTGTFTIAYDCDDGETHDGTVTLAAGGSETISGIPTGTSCTVTEPNLPTAPAGWTFGEPSFFPESGIVTVNTSALTNNTIMIAPVGAEVTVTNTISRDLGELNISKVFDASTSGFADTFAIDYDCDDGETHDGTVYLYAGGSETISGIPTGTSCTVTEPNFPTAPTGWTFGTATFNPIDGTVTISETLAEVTVTNTISRDLGELKISKAFDPLTSGFTGTFTISYDCDDGETHDGTVTLAAGGSETITGIPTGTMCWVSEGELPTAPEGWVFLGPIYNPKNGAVTISDVSPTFAEVTVTNYIQQVLGELKISKIFDPLTSGFTGTFEISYDCDDGETHDGTVTLAAGGSETITGIPTGTQCTITEDTLPTPPTGWSFGTPTFNPADGIVTISETLAEVTVTNTISRDLGELKISKVFDPLASGFSGTFTISYDCDDGTAHDGTVTLAAGGSETISGIPTGTTCTVTEPSLPTAPTGWTFGTPTFSPETGVVTVNEVSPAYVEVVVTNTISRDLGELKISKVFDPLASGFTGTFTISYDCDEGTAHDGTVTLAAGGSETISGIPIGTTCTVTEPNLPTAPTGWTFGTPTYSPTDGTITISETIAEVTVTNTISPEMIDDLSQLVSARTKCSQFADGMATDLERLFYTVTIKKDIHSIKSISPSTFLYYVTATLPAEATTLEITQENDAVFPAMGASVTLYDQNCVKLSPLLATVSITDGKVTINVVEATTERVVIVAVKYTAKPIIGLEVTEPYPIPNYTFSAGLIGDDPFTAASIGLEWAP